MPTILFISAPSLGVLDFLAYVLLFVVIVLIIRWIRKIISSSVQVHSHWQHHFVNANYSTQVFYQQIEQEIAARNLPSLNVFRVTYSRGGVFSGSREYLRVQREHLVFDICAAPYGNDFFVSWWQGDTPNLLRRLILSIPGIGKSLEKTIYSPTYYQMDTEKIFKDSIHASVVSAIDTLTSPNGIRPLSEQDRRIPEHA